MEEVIHGLAKDYEFSFFYSDASDSELSDHFECTRLPTIVIYKPDTKDSKITQSVRTSTAPDLIKQNCRQKLILDEDF